MSHWCWQHARNNTVLPEEEVRVGLLNYALVLWIIVMRCTFFVNLVYIFLKWHQSMSVYSSWEHTFTPVCTLSIYIYIYTPNTFLAILLNSLAFFFPLLQSQNVCVTCNRVSMFLISLIFKRTRRNKFQIQIGSRTLCGLWNFAVRLFHFASFKYSSGYFMEYWPILLKNISVGLRI